MIIKIFNQGKGKGSPIINYLFNEEKHKNYKPEIVSGNKFVTGSIIDNTTRVHKYTTGVISFREGESLTEEQQKKLIYSFERTFAPFQEDDRINFLWVRHFDKGRLELHFVSPMTDLKTGKAFNVSPPGLQNQDFYKKFQAAKNFELNFKQVEKDKTVRLNDYMQLCKDIDKYKDRRKEFINKRFDTPKKIRVYKNKNKGVKNGKSKFRELGKCSLANERKIAANRKTDISDNREQSRRASSNSINELRNKLDKRICVPVANGKRGQGSNDESRRTSSESQSRNVPKTKNSFGSIEDRIQALSKRYAEAPIEEWGEILEELSSLKLQASNIAWQNYEEDKRQKPVSRLKFK